MIKKTVLTASCFTPVVSRFLRRGNETNGGKDSIYIRIIACSKIEAITRYINFEKISIKLQKVWRFDIH